MSAKTEAYKAPFDRFQTWFAEADEKEPEYANAVAVATVGEGGFPSVRMVLMKGWDTDGFVFYTNLDSRKGLELTENPNAAMLFHWKSLRRQIRIEGPVEPVTDEEADEYFATRPKASQIGAWASRQSRPMEGRFEFEAEIAKYTAKFAIGDVPRPERWSGFRLKPKHFEFWSDKKFRLHERHVYTLTDAGEWSVETLFP